MNTKEIYKNPTLYYILVPVMVALWPLFVWGVYLPNAKRSLKSEMDQYNDANDIMLEILALDPGRLDTDANGAPAEFAYASAVAKVASFCGIPSANKTVSSGPIITNKQGKKIQAATVSLKDVSITKFAKFLSIIQLRWADLECVQLKKLKKKAGFPDRWDVDLEFKYYY